MYAHFRPRRLAVALSLAAACGLAACGGSPDSSTGDSAPATAAGGAAPGASSGTPSGASSGASPAGAAWAGPYQLRGQLEGGRSVSGTLTLAPLEQGAPEYAATSDRVRKTYPSYAGPYYTARLQLAGAEAVDGAFSCAHGPSTPPPLVCNPTSPLKGLENATLVVQPGGRAILTGSHGEGVTVEYGRFSWTPTGS